MSRASLEMEEGKVSLADCDLGCSRVTVEVMAILINSKSCSNKSSPRAKGMFKQKYFYIFPSLSPALEISCQILMSMNCCSKIFIYLLMYEEFWTSVRSLKNCFRCSSAPREVKMAPLNIHSISINCSFLFFHVPNIANN